MRQSAFIIATLFAAVASTAVQTTAEWETATEKLTSE